jgi:phycocyanobilin:ferredoxin oxidoreductase
MERQLVTTWRAVPGMAPLALPPTYKFMRSSVMTLRNECYTSRTFRKVHIEHASCPGDLEVVHHVAFPHCTHNIPILGVDVVSKKGYPTMAIADVSGDAPWALADAVWRVQQQHTMHIYKRRVLPAWGTDIFSASCVFLDSPNPLIFQLYVKDLLKVYIDYAATQHPSCTHVEKRTEEQRRYCMHQLQNDRTRSLLVKAFGAEMADGYMRDVMFDCV